MSYNRLKDPSEGFLTDGGLTVKLRLKNQIEGVRQGILTRGNNIDPINVETLTVSSISHSLTKEVTFGLLSARRKRWRILTSNLGCRALRQMVLSLMSLNQTSGVLCRVQDAECGSVTDRLKAK